MDPEQAKQIQALLDERRDEFRGQLWRPRRLFGVTVVDLLMDVIKELVEDVEALPLDDLPKSGSLTKWRHELKLAYEKIVRNRLFDQAVFFRQIGVVFDTAGKIFEELARLERMGYFTPSELET